MSKTMSMRAFAIASAVTTLALVGLTAAPAHAVPVNWLCRATSTAPVYSDTTGAWIYSIQAGHDMRLYDVSADPTGGMNDLYHGHGEGHSDGHSYGDYFGLCRAV